MRFLFLFTFHQLVDAWSWASAEIFPGRGKVDILLYLFQVFDNATQMDVHKRLRFSAPQRKCPMLRQQLHTVLSF